MVSFATTTGGRRRRVLHVVRLSLGKELINKADVLATTCATGIRGGYHVFFNFSPQNVGLALSLCI